MEIGHDPWVLGEVEIDGAVVDVVIADGLVQAVVAAGDGCRFPGPRLDGEGGALIPGLHDHHLHLLALAAALGSVKVGPPEVGSIEALAAALRGAALHGGWVRAVGYHESVAGPLDRWVLDQLAGDRPVRLQDRSGAMWVLSSAGCAAIDLEGLDHPGVERSSDGQVTGRVFGADAELAARWGVTAPPDLAEVGRLLAGYGVTACTDATPFDAAGALEVLAGAARRGDLPQRVTAMGGPALVGSPWPAGLAAGPVKLWAADHALPTIDELAGLLRRAHGAGRAAAVHCVTLEGLVVALAAWREAGAVPGDRIEHGAVVPVELMSELVSLGLTVVTQPGFVAARGDRYLADVDPRDRGDLWRCASLGAAGVPVLGSSDAPFGPADPWVGIAAAIDRRTAGGAVLGGGEALRPREALGLWLASERVAVGQSADLCLLDEPLTEVLASPGAGHVRLTTVAGRIVTPG